jgi:hypothetical protein
MQRQALVPAEAGDMFVRFPLILSFEPSFLLKLYLGWASFGTFLWPSNGLLFSVS